MFCLLLAALFAGDAPALRDVNDFGYQLQKVDPEQVSRSAFDLFVTDPSRDGTDAGMWSEEEMALLKGGPGGPRVLLAYLSFGEAEDYRGYWDASWKPGAPAWLGEVNPDWEGNYPVKYWEPAWKGIMFGRRNRPLDVILEMEFDGVYLDVIDSYEYWEGRGVKDADERAREAVIELSRYAKSKDKGFLVFVQNAAELGDSKEYRKAIDGIGREDLYYEDDDPRDDDVLGEATRELDRFAKDGKKVLVIDYCAEADHVADVYSRARKKEYVPYCAVRALDDLTVHEGLEPD